MSNLNHNSELLTSQCCKSTYTKSRSSLSERESLTAFRREINDLPNVRQLTITRVYLKPVVVENGRDLTVIHVLGYEQYD